MPSLIEVEGTMRDALLSGETGAAAGLVRGGAGGQRRFAIHQRHYATSLTRALVERFPATVWLLGSEPLVIAARSFIREQPPAAPCIAEYGEQFPQHLGAHPATRALPYVAQFAELEWHMGRLALATDESPNAHRMRLDWALDELISLYLTDTAPEQFVLRREEVWLDIRGNRGELQVRRLGGDAAGRQIDGTRQDGLAGCPAEPVS